MIDTFKSLLPNLKPSQRFIIAYSGGLDSHVLLHLLAKLFPGKTHEKLYAVHVNHGWSVNAKDWENHCQMICEQLNVPYRIIHIPAKPKNGESAEAFAREMRYQALSEILQMDDYLLTAHHRDDQAETVLLQLFRGTGVKGLSAMSECAPFGKGFHLRPLLSFTRAELQAYAELNHLKWIEDESNEDLHFDRNYIRKKLMPLVKQRWSSVAGTLSRCAQNCADAVKLLQDLAEMDMQYLSNREKKTLSISGLMALNESRRKNVLRFWLHQLQEAIPTQAQLNQINQTILNARQDANPVVTWDDISVRRYRDELFLFRNVIATPFPTETLWDFTQALTLSGLGMLYAEKKQGEGINSEKILHTKLTVRFRQGGEIFHPLGRQGSHPLKKLMQEWAVPPWERDRVPLIYINDELIAVAGYAVSHDYAAKPNEYGWCVKLS